MENSLSPQPKINHIAFLVTSAKRSAQYFEKLGLFANPLEIYDDEGTREIYIGDDATLVRILLLEAFRDGPYKNALKKRGTGLHHIAIETEQMANYIEALELAGWSIHPKYKDSYIRDNLAYLYKKGVPLLIELYPQRNKHIQQTLVKELSVPVLSDLSPLIAALNIETVICKDVNEISLVVNNIRIFQSEFVNL